MIVRRTTIASAVSMVVALGLLTGCALLDGPPVDRPERPTVDIPTAEPDQPAKFVPGGSAEENLPIFHTTLEHIAGGDTELSGRLLVDGLVEAGFDRQHMQVSFDRTPTNLVVDNLYVASKHEAECLIGQVDTATRELFVDVAPTVGPEGSLCLIGETKPIDW